MVRIVFGEGLEQDGDLELPARTLGEALSQVDRLEGYDDLRVFVDGVEADQLEGNDTPVGDEDTVLVTRW